MLLGEFSSGVQLHWDWSGPVIALAVVGLATLCLSLLFGQKSVAAGARQLPGPLPGPKPDATPGKTAPKAPAAKKRRKPLPRPVEPPVSGLLGEQRRSVRRKGNPIRVQVSIAGQPGSTTGWVVNRSMGGLGVVLRRRVAVGTRLGVRAAHAPDSVPPIEVEVRNNRPKGKYWMHGCQFTDKLPVSVLLLFG